MHVKPQIKHLYRFDYNGKKRVALLNEVVGGTLKCYDFCSEEYRNFYDINIHDAEDVTLSMVVTEDEAKANEYHDAGCKSYRENSTYYIVNV